MTHIIQTENRLSDCRHSTRMPLHCDCLSDSSG